MNLQEQEDFIRNKLENYNSLDENEKANLVLCCVCGLNVYYQNMEKKNE